MKPDSAFVGPDSRTELHSISAIYLDVTPVVFPTNAKHYGAVGLGHALEQARLLELRVDLDEGNYALRHFKDCLQKFRFSRISALQVSHKAI